MKFSGVTNQIQCLWQYFQRDSKTISFSDYLENFLAVPRTRLKTYGDRAFSAAAPRLWNQLPPELRSVTSVDQFRSQLKTYLFKLAYDV